MYNWIYKGASIDSIDIFNNAVGFVYIITNNITGKKYIGKKNFWVTIIRKPLKGQKKKRREKKESDWRDYYGSCIELLNDLELHGPNIFKREILEVFFSKGDLSYGELKYQVINNVLHDKTFYNGIIQVRIHKNHVTEFKYETPIPLVDSFETK